MAPAEVAFAERVLNGVLLGYERKSPVDTEPAVRLSGQRAFRTRIVQTRGSVVWRPRTEVASDDKAQLVIAANRGAAAPRQKCREDQGTEAMHESHAPNCAPTRQPCTLLHMSPELGRFLVVVGILLVVVGGLAMAGIRLPFGRLPGDIAIGGERGGIFIPLGTMLVISIVLSLLASLFLRR